MLYSRIRESRPLSQRFPPPLKHALRRCLILITISGPGAASLYADEEPLLDYAEGAEVWQEGPYCGVNSLYCLLRLEGVEVSHDDVMRALSPSEKGNSFEELRLAAKEYGLDTNVIRTDPDAIHEIELPFIAHMKTRGGMEHYILIYGFGDLSVYGIDGTDVKALDIHDNVFYRGWTGNLLVPTAGLGPSRAVRVLWIVLYTEFAVLVVLGVWLVVREAVA